MNTITDIVGFPEFDDVGDEDVSLDARWLTAEGTVRVSFGLRVLTRCPQCEGKVPVNGVSNMVICPGCLTKVQLTAQFWQTAFSPDRLAVAFSSEPGKGGFYWIFDYQQNSYYRRESPHCHGCGASLPDSVLNTAPSGLPINCLDCGDPVTVRRPDALTLGFCPGACAVVSETLSGGLATPLTVRWAKLQREAGSPAAAKSW